MSTLYRKHRPQNFKEVVNKYLQNLPDETHEEVFSLLETYDLFVQSTDLNCSVEECEERITNCFNRIVEKYNFSYRALKIRHIKDGWGYCSTEKDIYIDMKAGFLDDIFLDYIILHEFVHTRVKGHEVEFWAELSLYQ